MTPRRGQHSPFTGTEEGNVEQVFVIQNGRSPVALTTGEPAKVLQEVNSTGTAVLFTHRAQDGGGGLRPNARFGGSSLPASTATVISGTAPALLGRWTNADLCLASGDPDTQLLVAAVVTPDRLSGSTDRHDAARCAGTIA